MRPPSLLSTDPRTAAFFAESGCQDVPDSQFVLNALGSDGQVHALARGRHSGDPVVIVVTNDRVRLVSVDFGAGLVAAWRGESPVLLDAPVQAVTSTHPQRPPHVPLSGAVLLQTATARFAISDIPHLALGRLSQVLLSVPEAFTTPAADDATVSAPRPAPSQRTATKVANSAEVGPPASDWRQAEQLAVWHLRRLGYRDARATPGGADAGLDVIASGAVAQVKYWAQQVGQPPLRDLFGAAQAAGAKPFFYSLTGYTPHALEFAQATNMPLFTYSAEGHVVAQNAPAHDLERGSTIPGGKRPGIFAQARADRYRREEVNLRREIDRLTGRMQKRTQSRRSAARQAAGDAASLLLGASRALDAADLLPPADRRREDFHKLVREAMAQVRRLL